MCECRLARLPRRERIARSAAVSGLGVGVLLADDVPQSGVTTSRSQLLPSPGDWDLFLFGDFEDRLWIRPSSGPMALAGAAAGNRDRVEVVGGGTHAMDVGISTGRIACCFRCWHIHEGENG